MNKEIVLRDYMDIKQEFIIENFENVDDIHITVISGDEIADIEYKDGQSITFDSSNSRSDDFIDCYYNLPLEFIDEFSKFTGSSYQCYDYIKQLKNKKCERSL